MAQVGITSRDGLTEGSYNVLSEARNSKHLVTVEADLRCGEATWIIHGIIQQEYTLQQGLTLLTRKI